MRARNIKPGFFKNENLAECSPLARILFAGLWCLADREGRLEDRPKRIKAEILSYDTCDIDALLGELVGGGFIGRYERDGYKVIQINAFRKHQYPHHKEMASVLPGNTETGPENPGLDQGKTEFVPKATHLNPSSLNPSSLNPSSLNGEGETPPPAPPPKPKSKNPTLEEVRQYCQSRGNSVDPEKFFDHYTANGWKQSNGNAIKDWEAAVRTWEKRQNDFGVNRMAANSKPLRQIDILRAQAANGEHL